MKVKGIKITIILSLLASVLMPFSVYADTISQIDVQGVERVLVNSTYLDQTVTNSGNTYKYYSFDYEVTVLLKDYYLGWIQGVFQTSYKTFDNANWQVQNSSCTTVSKSYYVNDNKFKSSFTITAWVLVNQQGNVDPTSSYSTSFTLSNSNVTKIQDISSIDQIVELLDSINVNIQTKQWSVPIESIAPISYSLNKEYPLFQFAEFNNYQFPLFEWTYNDTLYEFISATSTGYNEFYMIILANVTYSTSGYNSNLKLTDGSYTNSQTLFQFRLGPNNSDVWRIVKLTIGNFTTTTADNTITFKSQSMNLKGCILYFGSTTNKNISTDFALQFGLSNQLLEDVHSIANANNNYDQSKDDLDDDTSDFVTDSGNIIQIEENYLDDLDTSLQSIDTNTGLNIFGGNFLTSATWVRTQFDRLTYNNPFGSLIVYGMTLGLALLLLGKVML